MLRPLAITFFACLLTSCATWTKPEASFRVSFPPLPSDKVVCEVGFLQRNTQDENLDRQFWQQIDEQILSNEVRQRLADNGLRIGLISGPLPEEVRKKLEATADPVAALTAEKLEPGTEMLSERRKVQFRDGITEKIDVLPPSSKSVVVLTSLDGRVSAHQFDQADGFFAVTSFPQPDGRVRLELIPGFEFGTPKQRIIGNKGVMRYDMQRSKKLFEFLTATAELQPGQTLVVTSTPESKGLGATLFSNRFTSSTEKLYLLIRLSRVDGDDLFAPTTQPESLLTTPE